LSSGGSMRLVRRSGIVFQVLAAVLVCLLQPFCAWGINPGNSGTHCISEVIRLEKLKIMDQPETSRPQPSAVMQFSVPPETRLSDNPLNDTARWMWAHMAETASPEAADFSDFPGDITASRTLSHQFISSLGREILKNREYISIINNARQYRDYRPEDPPGLFALYNGEMEDFEYIERDIIVNALSHALADAFEQTPPGKAVKRIEEQIIRYCTVKYSKSVLDDKGHLYLPGQAPSASGEIEKDYDFSVTSFFHINSDSLRPEVSVRVAGDYYGTKINMFYDIADEEMSMMLENMRVNRYVGARTSLAMLYNPEDRLVGVIALSFDF